MANYFISPASVWLDLKHFSVCVTETSQESSWLNSKHSSVCDWNQSSLNDWTWNPPESFQLILADFGSCLFHIFPAYPFSQGTASLPGWNLSSFLNKSWNNNNDCYDYWIIPVKQAYLIMVIHRSYWHKSQVWGNCVTAMVMSFSWDWWAF